MQIEINTDPDQVLDAVDLYYVALAAYIRKFRSKGIAPIMPDRKSSTIGRYNCYLRKDGFLLAVYNSKIEGFQEITMELIDKHSTVK